ncbi:dethiobiotin synthase [Pasteurella atlantica]|uniref:dethiobiotin synthase n=1 Tax=Pasteurellaceae TaxID=712 RepID=UPI002769CC86|nr:dethiobiotin synthase [Pasteurella atlantica]MDP8033295.1 dethiobiotin synthase [Pasteurella atlantica]MDP8035155.1 dethiobiotin synthase [Pasteurella atlantica]MDP8037105.1 dethiobiotin synthase [Pasteurella atlantica]MDP8047292.1 dethiobiotin synthase [Pasteurella atlantica]MDP8049484.1 dethiobiotin synthase [Pasteurella atlantica]
MASLFIAGTDTGVGKTIVTRAFLQLLAQHNISVAPYKPIACGTDDDHLIDPNSDDYICENNKDVLILQSSCAKLFAYQEITSYSFNSFSMPIFSALGEINGINIDKLYDDLYNLEQFHRNVLVEGTHGWLTPINKEYNFEDWVKSTNMPVVLVVGIKEGCVNHAQLTAQAIRQKGVNLIGWVANRINPGLRYYPKLIELLDQKIDAPLLGEIPYIRHPAKQMLTKYIQNPQPLLQYFDKPCN